MQELLRAERRLQRRVLVLAWETWVNAAAAAASVVAHQVIVRQHSEQLQRRSVAAGFVSWAGAADCRRQQRRLAKRAAARIRVCTLSAAWNGWADEAAAPAAEDEEDPSQAPNIPPPLLLYCDAVIISIFFKTFLNAFPFSAT